MAVAVKDWLYVVVVVMMFVGYHGIPALLDWLERRKAAGDTAFPPNPPPREATNFTASAPVPRTYETPDGWRVTVPAPSVTVRVGDISMTTTGPVPRALPGGGGEMSQRVSGERANRRPCSDFTRQQHADRIALTSEGGGVIADDEMDYRLREAVLWLLEDNRHLRDELKALREKVDGPAPVRGITVRE